MSKGELVYLDTSVISAYFDTRSEARMAETLKFFDNLSIATLSISDLVTRELELISDARLRHNILKFVAPFRVFQVNEEAESLAEEYVEESIVPSRYFNDALHIAIAIINNVNVLVSWNFEHLVRRKTKVRVNYVNSLKGYKPIDIVSPLDF